MANLTGNSIYQDFVRALETTDPLHPDTWNPIHQALINNDAYLKTATDGAKTDINDLAGRVGSLEETSSVSVQRAVTLDWLYRDNRIAFELWAPGFTLIDAIDTAIVQGIAGDDSVDVASTAQLRAGEYYVLADEEGSLLIKCTAVLSENRIRIDTNLPRTLGTGVLTRCSMEQVGAAHAICQIGDIWLSKPIDIGSDAEGGAVVVRRSLNSGEARLYYRDAYTTAWAERVWSVRRQGGDIPAGFADYEYVLPMRGAGNLMIAVEGEPMTILHIVAVSSVTGLGGFANPATHPSAPVIASPASGATGVPETPTLAIAGYSSPVGTPQGGVRFQVGAAGTSFATIAWDSGARDASLSCIVPAGYLTANTGYDLRASVMDISGLWSAWSATVSFTTMTTFAYVSAPALVSPVDGATGVLETPKLQTGAFAVVGGTDTHAASQWQVRTFDGTWDVPAYDSGEDAVNLLLMTLPTGILEAGQKRYCIRARHKGTALGWSEWSIENTITTAAMFASIVGVTLLQAGGDGGTWAYVDADGNTIAAPADSYFNAHPVWGGMQDVIIDGQYMVKVPKFYCRRDIIASGSNIGKEGWWISDQPVSGYTIHPAFRNAGLDIDQFYYGKYQASLQAEKLASVPGVLPVVSRSLTQFQADAAARNVAGVTGFMLHSFYQLSAIQWLYLVKNATMNSQAKTGLGRVNESSAANVDASDVAQASFQGIVGLWGNVYQWIDGLKTASNAIWMWDKDGNRTLVSTSQKRTAAAGTIYPTTFMAQSAAGYDFGDVFIGDTGPTTNSNATAPDHQYFSEGNEYFPLVGGYWGHGASAGLWCVNCSGSASHSNTNIGARLAKV